MTHNYYKFAEAGKSLFAVNYCLIFTDCSRLMATNGLTALLVFALNSLDSFNMLSQHLVEILSKAENAKIFLVGNKSDLPEPYEVTDEMVDQFIDQFSLEQFPKFNGFFKISCKSNNGVNEMFEEISKNLSSTNNTFKETFDTFTLHGHHTPGLMPCCTPGAGAHSHEPKGSDDNSFSCCAK